MLSSSTAGKSTTSDPRSYEQHNSGRWKQIRIGISMAARVNVVLVPAGIKVFPHDQEVKMEIIPAAAVDAIPGRNIWTASITDCATVATFDHATNSRTLCHGGGGNFAGHPGYIKDLALKISADTTIIFALGTDWHPSHPSERTAIKSTKSMIEHEMQVLNKKIDRLTWVEFWAPSWTPGQLQERASFVLCPNGMYGEKLR
jgi:hypothetical protein